MEIEFNKLAELINYIPSDVLAKLLTVDGANSGLDADKLDGLHASAFLLAAAYTASDVLSKIKSVDGPGSGLDADTLDGTELATINSAIAAKLNSSSYTAADVLSKIKSVDGPGSGLDADLLDSHEASYFLAASAYTAADILSKLLTVDGPSSGLNADLFDNIDSDKFMYVNPTVIPDAADLNNYSTTGIYYQANTTYASNGSNYPISSIGILEVFVGGTWICQRYTVWSSSYATIFFRARQGGTWSPWTKIWTSLNGGSNSGLDADKLDGQHGSYYLPANSYTATDVLNKLLTVDGSGTGLDADKLDGNEASAFLLLSNYIESSSFSNGSGYIKLKNSLLIQWGRVSITPVANGATPLEVTFPLAFTVNPAVFVNADTGGPFQYVKGVSASSPNTTATDIVIYRVDTTPTSVWWLAIGK